MKKALCILMIFFFGSALARAQAEPLSRSAATARILPALEPLVLSLQSLGARISADDARIGEYAGRLGLRAESLGYLAGVHFGTGTPAETDAEHAVAAATATDTKNDIAAVTSGLSGIEARQRAETEILGLISDRVRAIARIVSALPQ